MSSGSKLPASLFLLFAAAGACLWAFSWSGQEPVSEQADPGAPQARLELNIVPNMPAPCYYVADISLASGSAPGFWGLEILFSNGQKLLSGGINFGGAFAANGVGESFAAFNIVNSANAPQVVILRLDLQALTTPGFNPAAVGLQVRILDAEKRPLFGPLPTLPTITPGVHHLEFQAQLNPGFYSINLKSAPGSPMGTFQLGATTRFPDGSPAGFQGGAVVGGYLARDPAGQSIHGFAGLCMAESQVVDFKTVRYDTIGPLLLLVKDSSGRVVYDSSAAVQALGYGNLRMEFEPDPSPDAGGGKHNYAFTIRETNGVGVRVTGMRANGADRDFNSFFNTNYVGPWQLLRENFTTTFGTPLTDRFNREFELIGDDDQGHAAMNWRAAVLLTPSGSRPYAHLLAEFVPNPAAPSDEGYVPFQLRWRETNGIGLTLREILLNDKPLAGFKDLLGTDRLGPQQSLASNLAFEPEARTGEVKWTFRGQDDNGIINLEWVYYQRLVGFIPLLSGVPRKHVAMLSGYLPFQFSIYIPAGTAGLTLELNTGSGLRGLDMFVRGGQPVGNTIAYPVPPTADISRFNLGSATLVIDGASTPRLAPGTYYIAIARTLAGVQVPFDLRATLRSGGPTTTLPLATSTTTTSSTRISTSTTTSTTRVSTSTTTSRVSTSTTTTIISIPGTTTTTSLRVTTTTLVAGSWQLGNSLTYSVPAAANSTLQDSLTGHTFWFPKGGTGKVTITRILSGPETDSSENAFQIALDGQAGVWLSVDNEKAGSVSLLGYGSDQTLKFSSDRAIPEGWHAFPPDRIEGQKQYFELFLPGYQPASSGGRAEDLGWSGVSAYKLKKFGASAATVWESFANQIREAGNELINAVPPARQAALRTTINTSPPRLAIWACSKDCNQYMPFFYFTWGYLSRRTIQLDLRSDPAQVGHEFGHYVHHMLLGDDNYYYYYSTGSEGHKLGSPMKTFIEEPAFLAEYYLAGIVKGGLSPERGNWLAEHVTAAFDSKKTIQELNFPELEGSSIAILGGLVRREPQMRNNFLGRQNVSVPVIDLPDVKTLFQDAYEAIASLGKGIDTMKYLEQLEKALETKYGGQQNKLPAILQSIGWNYRVKCRFVDPSTNQPIPNLSAQPVSKIGSMEVLLPVGQGLNGASVTGKDGLWYMDECFPGDSWLRIYAGNLTPFDIKISINRKDPTNQLQNRGDILIALPEPPPPPAQTTEVSFIVFRRVNNQRQYSQSFDLELYSGDKPPFIAHPQATNGYYATTGTVGQGYSYKITARYTTPTQEEIVTYGSFAVKSDSDTSIEAESSKSSSSVRIEPTTALLPPMGFKRFYATVASPEQGGRLPVNWVLLEPLSGIITRMPDGSSIYLAPADVSDAGVDFHLEARASNSVSATATIRVTKTVTIQLRPQVLALPPGGKTLFTATVFGSLNTDVDWLASGGTISPRGGEAEYTAPAQSGTYQVTARSKADPKKEAVATITVPSGGVQTLSFGGKVERAAISSSILIPATLTSSGSVVAPYSIGGTGQLVEPSLLASGLGGIVFIGNDAQSKPVTVGGALSCVLGKNSYTNSDGIVYTVKKLEYRRLECVPTGPGISSCTESLSASLGASIYSGGSIGVGVEVTIERYDPQSGTRQEYPVTLSGASIHVQVR